MSKHHANRERLEKPGNPTAGRGFLFLPGGVVLLALAMLGLWMGTRHREDRNSARQEPGTNLAAAASQPRRTYAKLLGKWMRPDGGYVIEIKSAGEDGKLEAGYYNPSPIHVARAEASGQGSMIKVFIELQDVNYPGSSYTLAYDPAGDQLKGVYYQAVEQQHYEIEFERVR